MVICYNNGDFCLGNINGISYRYKEQKVVKFKLSIIRNLQYFYMMFIRVFF